MKTLTISLNQSQDAFVKAQMAAEGFRSASDYISSLIAQAEIQKERERINGLLRQGLESEVSELTAQDWVDMRREARQQLARENRNASKTHQKKRST